MKYCGYCGASIVDSAVSFCSECGQRLVQGDQEEQQEKPVPSKKVRSKPKKEPVKRMPNKPQIQEISDEEKPQTPEDEFYDGYYDDVEPEDHGRTIERMDPKLIRQILLIGIGALLLIGIGTLVIYFI